MGPSRMHPAAEHLPAWLTQSVATLAVTRGERVLVADALPANAVAQIKRSVGARGIVLLATRRPSQALCAAAAAIPGLEVLDLHLSGDGGEDLGRFDAFFAAPVLPGLDPPARFARIARHALRVGGRALMDLPGLGVNDDLSACLRAADARIELTGCDADAVRTALVAAGLRDVAVTARTCLELMTDASALVELAASVIGKDVDLAALRIAATRILAGRPEPLQSVWRRVRALARR